MRFLLFPALLLGVVACHTTERSSTSDLAAAAAAAGIRPAPSIDDVAWLAGTWRGDGLGGEVEESWSAPVGGAMVGHFRLVKDGAVAFYEIMTLGPIDDAGALGMKVKHFDPDLTGWEEKERSVVFPLRSIEGGVVTLDGVRLRRIDDDRMEIELDISSRDGSVRQEVFRYRRVGGAHR